MSFVSTMLAHPVGAALGVTVLAGSVGLSAGAVFNSHNVVSVVRVVDGDTIKVGRAGEQLTVRLLNVDTPETKDPSKPVQCLGPEATEYLTRLLPAGTKVTLKYDEKRHDSHGRELAGVYLDDLLVNAEIARAGYGIPKVYDGNDRFYEAVRQAQLEAIAGRRGLYSPNIECTLPAQVSATEKQAQTARAEPAPTADLAAIDARQVELDRMATDAAELASVLSGDQSVLPLSALSEDSLATLRSRVTAAQRTIAQLSNENQTARTAEVQRQEQIRAEEARRAAEAAKAAQEEAARRAAASNSAGAANTSRGSTPQKGSGVGKAVPAPAPAPAVDEYTGCRAYGKGGTSIDSKGRRYTKIDCVTKMPIG